MALTPKHTRDSKPKGGNGPTGKPKLHSINAGKSGHPVGGKGKKVGGKAY